MDRTYTIDELWAAVKRRWKVAALVAPAVAAQVSAIAHAVFVSAYIDAMKTTFVLPIAFLVLTAFTTLLIKRRKRVVAEEPVAPEQVQTAAG